MQAFLSWLNFLTLFFVSLGALAWGFFAFGVNLLKEISFGSPSIEFAIYMAVAISAALHLFSREFPYSSTRPCGSLVPKTPDHADASVAVKVEPNSNVIFWADGEKITDPVQAYSEFSNAGVTRADVKGIAIISVRSAQVNGKPAEGSKKVYYRTCDSNSLGPVRSALLG